jgi:hypothetical protein
MAGHLQLIFVNNNGHSRHKGTPIVHWSSLWVQLFSKTLFGLVFVLSQP